MIVNILQENLLKALVRTGRIVSSKPQLPIVQNVLLMGENGRLKVTATNLEVTETAWVGAKVEKEGGICVSSRLLSEFVLTLPQDTVHMTVQDGSLLVACNGFRATIPGVSAKEFPPVPSVEKKDKSPLEKEMIIDALHRVLFAAATDEGRPLLTGVRIIRREDEVVIAATDGYRLSVKRLKMAQKSPLDLIVPARALSEVLKVGQEEKGAEVLAMTTPEDGQLTFIIGDTEIHTRLIDGEYPNFEKIIPTTHTTRALIDKEKLVRAVKSAAIFARDNANIVRFHIENQTLTVSANTPQIGENAIDLEAKIDGEGGDVAFNSRFLLEFLTNFSEDELLFEMTGSLNPGVFKPVKDDSYVHIIMPVRVQGG